MGGGAGDAREPARCGITFDNPLVDRFAERLIHRLDLRRDFIGFFLFDGLPRFLHQSAQSRFDFHVAHPACNTLPMPFDCGWMSSQMSASEELVSLVCNTYISGSQLCRPGRHAAVALGPGDFRFGERR